MPEPQRGGADGGLSIPAGAGSLHVARLAHLGEFPFGAVQLLACARMNTNGHQVCPEVEFSRLDTVESQGRGGLKKPRQNEGTRMAVDSFCSRLRSSPSGLPCLKTCESL